MASSKTRQQLEDWIAVIDVDADRVIDIGGSQLSIMNRVNSWKVNEYKVLDLEEPHVCKQKPDVIFDLNTDGRLSVNEKKELNKGFDVAFCLEVSEYWYDPMRAIKNIAAMLKSGGILYISFHFIYPVHNPPQEDYMRYTKAGAEKLLEAAGFEIVFNRTRLGFNNAMQSLFDFYSKEKMRPTKLQNCHNEIGCLIECKKL